MGEDSGKLEVESGKYHAQHAAEDEARHVMGAVPWIELAIVAPVLCLVAAVLVVLFR